MAEALGTAVQGTTKIEQTVQAFRKQLVEAERERVVGQVTVVVDLSQGGINSSKIGVIRNVLAK